MADSQFQQNFYYYVSDFSSYGSNYSSADVEAATSSKVMMSSARFFPPILPPIDPPEPTKNSSMAIPKPEGEDEQIINITYEIILPIISSIGILGNSFIFFLLSRKKFNGFMFTYLKGLAIMDLMYLLFCLQASYLVSQQYFLASDYRNPPTQAFGIYVWNIMSPMWNIFPGASDLIIVCMTVDRYLIMRMIDQIHQQKWRLKRKEWFLWAQVVGALLLSTVLHLPYFFQFKVQPCNMPDYSTVNTSVTTESPLTPTPNCWTPETTPFAQSMAWTVYGYIYEIGMKIVPASIIGILNFLMLLKLNKVWRRKKKLKASMSCRQQCGSPRIGEGSTTTAATTATAATTQSVSTISMLLLKPPAIMAGISDVQMDETRFARLKNRMKPKPKKTKKKLILLHLPNKISRKETRMTILLLSIVFCHICLTMPSNLSYFLWTVFPDFWADYDGRVLFEAVSDVLCCINYSLNFYLYCVACKEIRDGVKDLWNSCWVCCCLCNCGGTI